MILLLGAALGNEVPSPPGVELGAICRLDVRFDNGKQSVFTVHQDCPEPFRGAIQAHYTAHPLVWVAPPDTLAFRLSFVVGRPTAVLAELGAPVRPEEHPLPGSRVHVTDDRITLKKSRFPRSPEGLKQPIVCRALTDFDPEGRLETTTITGCPDALAQRARESLALWRVKPTLFGEPVRFRTLIRFDFAP